MDNGDTNRQESNLETGIGKSVKLLALAGGYVLLGLMLVTVVAVFSARS